MKRSAVHVLLLCSVLGFPGGTSAQGQTEVVVMGTTHWEHLWNEDYSPTHLRALLSKISPDAVAIENFPHWQEAGIQFHPGLPESAVAMSWAEEHGVPVYGVKVDDVAGWERQVRAFRETVMSQSEEVRRRQFRSSAAFQAAQAFGSGSSLELIHTPEQIQRQLESRQRYTEEQRTLLVSLDRALADRIVETIRTHRPERLVVIHGSDHLGPTMTLVAGIPEARVIEARAFLPVTSDELDTAWRPLDAELVVGAALDAPMARWAPHARNLAWAKRELERLNRSAPSSAAALYYRGRWAMVQFAYSEAGPLLAQVAESARGADAELAVSQEVRWPPLTTYRALATFALANLEDLQGRHEQAVRLYRDLLATVQDRDMPRIGVVQYLDLAGYIRNLIESPYVGGIEEAVREFRFGKYLFWSEAPEPIRRLASEGGGG